ncbi:alcohol dehydrogenase catalytic domain-containing protein [Amycolatopsis kentuckyensis]|uniref:alcohol dehydrogenase catalytic domain-containing protein n=1 Tax=Amycolatopsis kentuckyensis TaxID=218823 RepID=UPI003EBB9DC3
MLASWYDRQGPAADVLCVGELADPTPGPEEVRVRVTVSGVNPGDTKKRRGWLGSSMPFPRVIPHSDAAGVVDAVGEGVEVRRSGRPAARPPRRRARRGPGHPRHHRPPRRVRRRPGGGQARAGARPSSAGSAPWPLSSLAGVGRGCSARSGAVRTSPRSTRRSWPTPWRWTSRTRRRPSARTRPRACTGSSRSPCPTTPTWTTPWSRTAR